MAADRNGQPRTPAVNGANGAPRAEWLVGLLGLLLVLVTIGYLVWVGLQPSRPASIAVQVDYVAEQPQGFMLRFTARNGGTQPAGDVQIRGELFGDGAATGVEVAEAGIDYLPGGSTRSGVLLFQHDPRTHRLQLRSVGYNEP